MLDQVTRRPIPIEQSILWKPLRDPHYVVASLQPVDGGRRKIFVRQDVLARVQALVRAHGRRTLGLLVGDLYECSVTGAAYLIVESVEEQDAVSDELEMASHIAQAVAGRSASHRPPLVGSTAQRGDLVGWYRGVPSVEARPSGGTVAVHTAVFNQPWQLTLVVGEIGHASGGALFLHDALNSRWFYAPFFELLSKEAEPNQPKRTLISWPQYITSDTVVLASGDEVPVETAASSFKEQSYGRPQLFSTAKIVGGRPLSADGIPPAEEEATASTLPRPRPVEPTTSVSPDFTPPMTKDPRPVTEQPVAPPRYRGLADVASTNGARPGARLPRRSGEKLSIVDDHPRVDDDEDTARGTAPARYIELARGEGFFVAGEFAAVSGALGSPETLWILHEPYSGLLLAVVATDCKVIDATLHYNLQTDDAGLQRTPFPEHRDLTSMTIYVRETCVDALRARCRRLRATNALLKEWKVTPTISFLTPTEWESVLTWEAKADRAVATGSDLTAERIAQLPAGVRSQFHFGGGESNT